MDRKGTKTIALLKSLPKAGSEHIGEQSFKYFSQLIAKAEFLTLGSIDIGAPRILYCGAALSIAGCLAASFASTPWIPVVSPPPAVTTNQVFRHYPISLAENCRDINEGHQLIEHQTERIRLRPHS